MLVGELAIPGEWVVAYLESATLWPVKAQKVSYRGCDVWILPLAEELLPAVAIRRPPGLSNEACQRLLLRFLSAVAWVERAGMVIEGIGGGGLPRQMSSKSQHRGAICNSFHLGYLPEPENDKALLALGLMREGRGLNHPGYSFLSFYRVLEVALGKGGPRQIDWINDQIAKGLEQSCLGLRRHSTLRTASQERRHFGPTWRNVGTPRILQSAIWTCHRYSLRNKKASAKWSAS